MRQLIIEKKTGFRTTLPFTILDRYNNIFYTDEFTDHIQNGKVLYFNLPKGKYFYNGSFIKLDKPVEQKEIILPKPDRQYDTGVLFKIIYGHNPNKCSIFHDKKIILFDNSFLRAPVFILYDIYFHELGHLYYTDEENADLFATKALLELGFNKTQIGLSPIMSLSEKNNFRKKLKINSLQ